LNVKYFESADSIEATTLPSFIKAKLANSSSSSIVPSSFIVISLTVISSLFSLFSILNFNISAASSPIFGFETSPLDETSISEAAVETASCSLERMSVHSTVEEVVTPVSLTENLPVADNIALTSIVSVVPALT
jgi:hypothetical protein